jgi:hypothetical protein
MFTSMGKQDRTPRLLTMDARIVGEQLVAAIRAMRDGHGWPGVARYELDPWCERLKHALEQAGVVFAYRENIVRIAEPTAGPKHWPARAVDIRETKPVSTPDLRRHVFAAYAQAMALYGAERAFESAVNETLRRQRGWNLATAVDHTRKFIVPAYERAMPAKRPVDPGDGDDPGPGAPARRAA